MRRLFALIIAVGLMTALLALPGTAVGRAEFTDYIGTETQTSGPILPEPLKGNLPIERTSFASVFDDVAYLPDGTTPYLPATGETFVYGTLIITETYELFPGFFVPFNAAMHGTSETGQRGWLLQGCRSRHRRLRRYEDDDGVHRRSTLSHGRSHPGSTRQLDRPTDIPTTCGPHLHTAWPTTTEQAGRGWLGSERPVDDHGLPEHRPTRRCRWSR